MITDERRREVAEKMREICRENPDVSLQTMVASVMNECLPEGMEYGPTLADLIDRGVCYNVYDESECGACGNGFECSVCGYRVEDEEHYHVSGTWNFCPQCGKRVRPKK